MSVFCTVFAGEKVEGYERPLTSFQARRSCVTSVSASEALTQRPELDYDRALFMDRLLLLHEWETLRSQRCQVSEKSCSKETC